MKKFLTLFIRSGFLLAIFTALLYVAGIAYLNGYLLTLGLDISILERSFNLTLYTGFIQVFFVFLAAVFKLLNYFFIFILCTSLLLTLYFLIRVYYRKQIKEYIKKWKKVMGKALPFIKGKFIISSKLKKTFALIQRLLRKSKLIARLSKHERTIDKIPYYFALGFIFLIIFYFFLLYTERQGKQEAQIILDVLKETDHISLQQHIRPITAYIRDQQLELYLLSCGSKLCAGIDPKTKEVYYFPAENHTSRLIINK